MPLSLFVKKVAIVFVNSKNPSIMKHLAQIAIVVAAALLAAACNKEPQPIPTPENTVRHVAYTVCGEPGSATTTGTDEWHALLDSLLTSAEGGCAVTFWNADLADAQPTKETVTYSTASRDSAFAWGERMYDQGYAVSVIYDPQTGQYNCSAVRTTSGEEQYYRNVGIASCGGVYFSGRRIGNETEWVNLLDSLFDVADSGCLIAVWNFDYIPNTNQTKSGITYSTPLRDSAYVWIDTMFNRNYCTTVVFDPVNRVYILTAKPLTTGPQWYDPDHHGLYYSFFSGLTLAVEAEVPLVINSQEQFDSLMPYTFLPYYIDFNTQSLICAWGTPPQEIYSFETSIEYNGNDVIVTIDILMNMYMFSVPWYIALPCNKITDDQNIILVVNKEINAFKK